MEKMSRQEKLVFSGKPEDFPFFLEQFEARIFMAGLHGILMEDEDGRADTSEDRVNKRNRVWCELVQCLDRKSVMMLRTQKGNGPGAWLALKAHFKGTERPRIQKLMRNLTSIRMDNGEAMDDYLLRAEDLQMELVDAGEKVSESMFKAMVLKGLPREYDHVATVINYGIEKDWAETRQDLKNFYNDRRPAPTQALFSGNVGKKCYGCSKLGHIKANCPDERRSQPKSRATKSCFNCGKPGHFARECRSGRSTQEGHAPTQVYAHRNPRPQGKASLSYVFDDPFSFMSMEDGGNEAHLHDMVVDSGSTSHMLKDRELFAILDEGEKGQAGCANATQAAIEGVGTAQLWVDDSEGTPRKITLNGAFYVPSYCRNLLSVRKLYDGGAKVDFNPSMPVLRAKNGTIFPMLTDSNLYVLACKPVIRAQGLVSSRASLTTWHERLGHNNRRDVLKLRGRVDGLDIDDETMDVCTECESHKAKRAAISRTVGTRADAPLDVVHMDVLGPLPVESEDGYRYAIGFIDSHSRYCVVYTIPTKDKVFEKVQQFVADVGKPRILASDCAKEFLSTAMATFCREQGIRFETSAPYTPEDNGKIERVWGTVMGMARCMMARARCPPGLWSFALRAAFHLKNRCLHSATGTTPYEAMFGKRPDLSTCKVFGCKVFVLVERGQRKLDARARPGVFLGYGTHSNTYTVGVPDDYGRLNFVQTRNVTFDESRTYHNGGDTDDGLRVTRHITVEEEAPDQDDEPVYYSPEVQPAYADRREGEENVDDPEAAPIRRTAVDFGDETIPYEGRASLQEVDGTLPQNDTVDDPTAVPEQERILNDNDQQRVRRPRRAMVPNEYGDWDAPGGADDVPVDRERRERQRPVWMDDYVDGEGLASQVLGDVPNNAKVALADPKWKKAMEEEYNSLITKGTWELCVLPAGRKAVSSKWSYKIKYGPTGEVTRYKARFCARGFTQVAGKDFNETFAPTVRMPTLRAMLACAAQHRAEVHQMDIKTAYLNAPLEEEVYLQQPEGFEEKGKEGHYLKLKKSLYGLKQSGRNWFNVLKDYLNDLGFVQSTHDACLFMRAGTDYVCVWVDDLVYFSKTNSLFPQEMKNDIAKKFTVGECGPLTWFLGMKVQCSPGLVVISQRQYITDLLKKFGMEHCRPATTPMAEGTKLTREDCPEPGSSAERDMREVDYRGLVGSLNYLSSSSRPDISYTAHQLSSYLVSPGMPHWTAAKHVLRYLQATRDVTLTYRHSEEGMVLHGYSDADWAGQVDSRRSTSGYALMVQRTGGAVAWSSRLQSTVATSTAEAEVTAAMAASQEAIWLSHILEDLGHSQALPTAIMVDNQAAIAQAKNPVHGAKTKHYCIRLQYLREQVDNGVIETKYIPTAENPADLLTKGLAKVKTQKFLKALTGYEV